MGLYDGDKPFAVENGFKDESQMKDHLIQASALFFLS